MVTANGGKTLSQAITYNHVDAYRVYKLLYLWVYCCTCCWEEMGILKSKLLAYQREYGLVQQLVFQMQRQWWALAF